MERTRYNRIKSVLAEKEMSNKELAEKLGIAVGTVSTWCRNFKQPKIETLYEIAKVLKLDDPRDLLLKTPQKGKA